MDKNETEGWWEYMDDDYCEKHGLNEFAQTAGYNAKGKNRYGVDTAYFRKEFAKLSRDLDNYTPLELGRYLERLTDVALEAL